MPNELEFDVSKVRSYQHETGILQFWAKQGGMRTYRVTGKGAAKILFH